MPNPLRPDPEFVARHNQLMDEENRRAQMIRQFDAEMEKAERNAKRISKLQEKYPWLRPRTAAVFSQVAQPDEDVMRVYQNEWKAHGMATDPETLAQMEKFVASNEFLARVRAESVEPFREYSARQRELFPKGGEFAWEDTPRDRQIGAWKAHARQEAADGSGWSWNPLEIAREASAHLPGGSESQSVDLTRVDIPGVSDVAETAKTAVRAGVMLPLESGYQEVQAQISDRFLQMLGTEPGIERTASLGTSPYSVPGRAQRVAGAESIGADLRYENTPFRARSTGGIALGKLLRGEPVPDSGNGIFVSGELRDEQMRRAREAGSLEGRAVTPGRILASTVVEPGTKPYNVISGVTDAMLILSPLDPANVALGAVGAANRARNVIRPDDVAAQMGGFRSAVRSFVDGPTAEEALNSRRGQMATEYFTRETDYLTMAQRTNWKLPHDVQLRLLDSTDEATTRAILEEELGITVREMPSPAALGAQVRKNGSRLTQMLPESAINMNRRQNAAQQIYRWMKNLKAPDSVISPRIEELARAGRGSPEEFEALRHVSSAAEDVLVARGIPRHEARTVTRMFSQDAGDFDRQWFVGEIADQTAMGRPIALDESVRELSSSHILAEHWNGEAMLPSVADVNKTIAKYSPIFGIPRTEKLRQMAHGSKSFLEHVQSTLWVPLVLLRGAWTVRVVGEEQLRLAASGLSNVFSHPIQHIAWIAATKKNTDFRSSEEFAEALSRRGGKFLGDTADRVVAKGQRVAMPDDPRFAEGWADEIITLNASEDTRLVAQALLNGTLDNLKVGFADGNLADLRRTLAQNPKNAEKLVDGNRAGSDYFIDTLATRVLNASGDDLRYLDTIAHGRYGEGEQVLRVQPRGPRSIRGANPLTVDRDFVAYLRESTPAPDAKGFLVPRIAKEVDPNPLDRAVVAMFGALMATPTNVVSRSTTAHQFYWQRIEEVFPYLDEADRARYIKEAHEITPGIKIPDFVPVVGGKEWDVTGLQRRLNQAHLRARGTTPARVIDYDLADELARGHALDKTRDLLYDLNRRSQFFDATRLLFPFGEAWKEVLTRWAKLGAEHPEIIRKGQIFIDGAREANPFEVIPGAMVGPYSANGDPSRQGFFYHDADYDEEMFVYPWTAAFTESQIGLPIPMTGRAQGLNMALQIMPGFGLAVQLPAMWAMDRWMEDPKWDPVRELIAPFGEPETGPENWLNTIAPPWMQKWLTSLAPWDPDVRPANEDARMLNNTIEDLAAAYISQGEFRPDQMAEAHEKAEDAARWLYRFRGSFQWGAPSAPSPRMVLEDKDGKLVRFSIARDAYYKLFKKDPATATEKFIERFGEDWMLAVAPKTITETYNAPVTKEALDWVRENPDVVKSFPLTYGMFAPQGGKFDYTAYLRQLATGERKPVSAKERWEGVNHVLGTIWYDRLRQQMGLKKGEQGSERQRRELAQAENLMVENYPGYKRVDLRASSVPDAVKELAAATGESRFPEGVRTAVASYLALRDEAIASAEAGGSVNHPSGRPAFASAKRNRPIREWLRGEAAKIIEDHPKFAPFWDRIFSREMDED